MSQSDWGVLDGSLTTDNARTGPTAGTPVPNGGGTHCYGMRSVGGSTGVVGFYCLQTNFSPTPTGKGGRITGALKRTSVGATDGFAPFLFFCAAGTSITDKAYIIGLSNESQSHIELRKGVMSDGLPPVSLIAPAVDPNILMRSTNVFPPDVWQHLRLDVIVQPSGDSILQVFRNDLSVNPVTSPVWVTVPGMEGPLSGQVTGFVDDALGVNTGSDPLTSGYPGFATQFVTSGRAAYFDHITVDRQL